MRKRGGGEGRVDQSAQYSDPTRDANQDTTKAIKKAYKDLHMVAPGQVKNTITAQSTAMAEGVSPEDRKKQAEAKASQDVITKVIDGAGIGKNHNKYFAVYKDYGTFIRDCHPAFYPVYSGKLHMQQA